MITDFVITNGEARKRLDVFLCHREPNISRSRIQRLIQLGRIRLNADVVKPSRIINPGDHITMDTPHPEAIILNGETSPLKLVYEDETLRILNKAAGIVVHPTSGNWSGTLLNSLLNYFKISNQEQRIPRLVHRLDKQTSGIMVVAKTASAHHSLTKQFAHHSITRAYEALLWSIPETKKGIIDLPIGRDKKNHKIISEQSDTPKWALTEYRVIKQFEGKASQVQLFPQTGRTHQLRAHMASIGCPILGDTLYGGKKVYEIEGIKIPSVMLHAHTLGFAHPSSKKYQEFSVESPENMRNIGKALTSCTELFMH